MDGRGGAALILRYMHGAGRGFLGLVAVVPGAILRCGVAQLLKEEEKEREMGRCTLTAGNAYCLSRRVHVWMEEGRLP